MKNYKISKSKSQDSPSHHDDYDDRERIESPKLKHSEKNASHKLCFNNRF